MAMMQSDLNNMMEKINRLQQEVRHCRNELCLNCGKYKGYLDGACEHCRYRPHGEWQRDLDEE